MPGATLPSKSKPTDDAHPFGLPWLDSCYQETLLPNGYWPPVSSKICRGLATRIQKQFEYRERKQMIFELMGMEYIHEFFPKEEYNPLLLEPPLMIAGDRRKLQIDAQQWLQNTISKVAAETHTQQRHVAEEHGEEISMETNDFLIQSKGIFKKGMDRHLLLLENEIKNNKELDNWEQELAKEASREARDRVRERARLQQERQRLYGDIAAPGLRSILKNADQTPQTRMSTATTTASRPVTANVKGALFQATADPPRFWSAQSDCLGRSLVAILKRDPRRMEGVLTRLHGRQLPGALRRYVWTDMLLKHERAQHADVNTESLVRERFVRAVKTGMSELRLKKATASPIQRVIENAVVETFEKTAAMLEYRDTNTYMRECAKALNVLYTYDRSYEPYLIHWLFPLQLCYEDAMGEGEHVYELAMYLDLLNKSMFPKWPEVFAAAETVMNRLEKADPELHRHLKSISQRDVTVNSKEFLVQMIHNEMSEADVLLKQTEAESEYKQEVAYPPAQLLSDPLIFIRKWIGEGFVGVLDTQAALYVWDQQFMRRWHLRVSEDTALALLLLLRYKFMRAHNYISMKEVFLKQPSLLYTRDLQTAWTHLQRGGEPGAVPPMNRLKPKTRDSSPAPRRPSPNPSLTSLVPLDPFAIGRVRLSLVVSADCLQQEKWLKDLRMDKLALECHVYFGDIKVHSVRATKTPLELERTKADSYGGVKYSIEYRPDELRFGDIDVGRFDLESEMGGYPYAIIELKYTTRTGDVVPLGWARIKLFQHRAEAEEEGAAVPGANPWLLLSRDQMYPLYSGPPLEKFASEDRTPHLTDSGRRSVDTLFLERYAELLADGSQLGAFVYNLRKPPPTPTPARPKSRRVSETPAPRGPVIPVPPPDTRPPPKTASPNRRTPNALTITDPFDIYVDAVTNIPDNATIVKVTGRLVKTGELKEHTDLLALPEPGSSARSPRFKYQYTVNAGRARLDPDLILLLRVYTVDADTRELVVVGSCFFEAFDDNQLVKLGSHARQVHSGLPDIKQGVKALNHNSLDKGARMPGCQLYFRLDKHSSSYKKPPPLDRFTLDDPPLNTSERKVAASFSADKTYPATVVHAVKARQQAESVPGKDREVAPLTWLQERLDQKRQLAPNQPADDLDLNRIVRYRQHIGFQVNVIGAYGLPEGYYYQCYATLQPGKDAANMRPTKEGWGRPDAARTMRHDWNSLQASPQWQDQAEEWHAHLDQHSVILVQLFQYDLKYAPRKDHSSAGSLTSGKGKALSAGESDVYGWSVVPLFEKEYVMSGSHHAPLLKGKPTRQMLDHFRRGLPETILSEQPWVQTQKVEGAALIVDVWDAHFKVKDIPGQLQRTDFLLDSVGAREAYARSEERDQGAKMRDLVAKHLDKKNQKPGGEVYQAEQRFFEHAAEEAYGAAITAAVAKGKVGAV